MVKCAHCKKKISITLPVFRCKCIKKKHQFCIIHRYPEEHNCTYDWKSEESKSELNSEKVSVPKIDNI